MLAQLVEDLVHLEGRQDRLDQDRRPDAAAGHPQGLLGGEEDVVPQVRLQVRLELRQVEVRAGAPVEQLLGVVEEGEAEVEDAGGNRRPVDQQVCLLEMPAARPNEERGYLRIELV